MHDELKSTSVDPLDELLVAYLDGELSPQEAEQVERRLAENTEIRDRLHKLEKAAELLSFLTRSAPTQAFTQATVTLAVEAAEKELNHQQRRERAQRWGWGLLSSAVACLALVVAYLTTANYLEAPNEKLRRDLPVLQRLDEYRTADSLEFLKQLEQAGLFVEEPEDAL